MFKNFILFYIYECIEVKFLDVEFVVGLVYLVVDLFDVVGFVICDFNVV